MIMYSKNIVSTFTACAFVLLGNNNVQPYLPAVQVVSAFQGMSTVGNKNSILNPSLLMSRMTSTSPATTTTTTTTTSLFSSEVEEINASPNKSADNRGPRQAAPFNNNFRSNQPKYGKELELPGTYVRCGRCFTNYAITEEDLGSGKGRRIECSLCSHSWFQTPERLFTLNQGHQLVPLPETEISRIHSNVENGREPDFVGNNKFYVGNLDFGVEEDDLRQVFQEVGQVGGVSIVTDPNGKSRGFAFVTMMDDEVTEKCMSLDGTELMGRNINVKAPNN
mmetsp:Transcript_11372/g.21277  ORF Transcript_11372/g.21277 Transcript_11372/m.21277 type:complete len:279 (-) Transcript_11372:144-980(-)